MNVAVIVITSVIVVCIILYLFFLFYKTRKVHYVIWMNPKAVYRKYYADDSSVRGYYDVPEDFSSLYKLYKGGILDVSEDEWEDLELREECMEIDDKMSDVEGDNLITDWVVVNACSQKEYRKYLTTEEEKEMERHEGALIFPWRFSSVYQCINKGGIAPEAITKLKVCGRINSVDLRYLRMLAGIGSYINYCWEYFEGDELEFETYDTNLTALDLSEAELVSDFWYRCIDSVDKHGCLDNLGRLCLSDYCHPSVLDDWFAGAAHLSHLILPDDIRGINGVPSVENLYVTRGGSLNDDSLWRDWGEEKPLLHIVGLSPCSCSNAIYMDAAKCFDAP